MRSRIVPLAGLALMIGGVAVAWQSGTREAQYKGRPASAWVAQLSSTTVADRVAAAEALGHITPGQAIEPLRNALADDSPLVSGNAALALSRYGAAGVPSLAAMLQHHRPAVRRTSAQGLGFAGKSAIHFLNQLVALLDDPDSSVRIETARALAKIGAPAVPAVVGALESASTRARAAAALALCEMGPVAGPASESLAVALRDAD
ncbi:MAG: HEAT repeat domain-containing protein, partial [Gemmataceae bacterium]|nr:HEAT repeat domain-containing protein [Gemmataceae bacterium]